MSDEQVKNTLNAILFTLERAAEGKPDASLEWAADCARRVHKELLARAEILPGKKKETMDYDQYRAELDQEDPDHQRFPFTTT